MRLRLSLLMFLQYAPAGAVLPLFPLYLAGLHFTEGEIGLACAMQAVGSAVAPVVVGQVADRWFAAERCLALLALLSGCLLFLLPMLATPAAVTAATLAFWLAMAPAITCGTTISFTHLTSPEQHYSGVRLWGTVGWMAASYALALRFFLTRLDGSAADLTDAFRLGGVLAFVLAGYALTLPPTPPTHRLGSPLAPLAALGLLRDRSFAVFLAGSVAVCLTGAVYSQTLPFLLRRLEVPRDAMLVTQTVAQLSEVGMMALLPMLLLRLEMRGSMVFGIVAWATGLGVLAVGAPLGLVVAALPSWGMVVACYLVAGQVFVNGRARGDIRTSAQALMTCCNATGMVVGNLAAGALRDAADGAVRPVFAAAAAVAFGASVVFLVGFRTGRGK